MKLAWGRLAGIAAAMMALFAVAALLAPEIEAGGMRQPVAAALERMLARKVSFREVRYQLFPAPGFTVYDLVIPDDREFGLEPMAYVTEMQVGAGWRSIFGNLHLSAVRLVNASLNLTRKEQAGWNLERLLGQMTGNVQPAAGAPSVVLEDCRINFRSGSRKSAYFLNNVDLEMDSPGDPKRGISWSFEASPARTDRAELGFGRFSGKGRWRPGNDDGSLDIELELEPSAISEVTLFLAGRDLGLHGRISSRARLGGPLQQIRVTGRLALEDINTPDLFGLRQPALALPFEGELDLTAQRFELRSQPPREGPAPPFRASLAATSLLTEPAWLANVGFDSLPAGTFLDLARRLGSLIPQGFAMTGSLSGSIVYSAGSGFAGNLELRESTVRLGAAGPLDLPLAEVTMRGSEVELAPAVVRTEMGSETTIQGNWAADTAALEFQAASEKLGLDEIASASRALPDLPPLPFLSQCQGGTVGGMLRFARGPQTGDARPGFWTGDVVASGTSCSADGIGVLDVTRVNLAIRRSGWSARRMAAAWGRIPLEGDITYQPELRRPLRADLKLEALEAGDLEALIAPAYGRRSLLERTFNLRRRSWPTWLRGRRVEATLVAQQFQAAGLRFSRLKARAFWDGDELDIPQLEAALLGGAVHGRLRIGLEADSPKYRFLGNVTALPWQEGWLDADIDASSSGFGALVLARLRAAGNFRATRVQIGEAQLRLLHGSFLYDSERRAPRLLLNSVGAEDLAGDSWSGQGLMTEKLISFELTSGRRALRLGGAAFPLWAGGAPAAEPLKPR